MIEGLGGKAVPNFTPSRTGPSACHVAFGTFSVAIAGGRGALQGPEPSLGAAAARAVQRAVGEGDRDTRSGSLVFCESKLGTRGAVLALLIAFDGMVGTSYTVEIAFVRLGF